MLSASQEAAVGRLEEAMAAGGGHFLLWGETGSGKTEVYLRACAAAVARGRDAIVLVPEIALTPQTLGRFRCAFRRPRGGAPLRAVGGGAARRARKDRCGRGANRRRRALCGVRAGAEPRCRVRGRGARPVVQAGVGPALRRAHRRRQAGRAREGAVAVYGSATPRPESWARLERLELGERLATRLPGVTVVDMRREAAYPLSGELVAALEGVAERRSRAIVLLNRRGVAPAVHCRSCGTTIRCPDCDVALVLHRDDVLRCHHCGWSRPSRERCDACGSPELMRIGAGTQRLETELARLAPGLERIRLDADTASKPAELAAALDRFRTTDGAVLLGTQMVAKGHHFAGVELAAVVDADLGLAMPDFRAEERTFQLVTQLAGRSGREAPGRVIVQTFQPDAPALLYAARHDVAGFLAEELARREALGYPPFRHIVRVLVSGRTADAPLRALTELKSRLPGDGVVGPAALPRLRGRHRAQLVAKTDAPRAVAAQAGRWLAAAAASMRKAGLSATVDVDPQSF